MSTNDTVSVTILLVVAALFAVPLLASPMGGLFGWGYMGTGTGGWGHMTTGIGGWGVLLMTAIPVAVLVGIGYFLYPGSDHGNGHGNVDPAIEELRAAYARGEIDDEEFENRRWRLREPDE